MKYVFSLEEMNFLFGKKFLKKHNFFACKSAIFLRTSLNSKIFSAIMPTFTGAFMANNVIFQALGGQKKVLDNVDTVSEVKRQVALEGNYTYLVNGESVSDNYELEDGDFITASQSVKGGR